MTSMNGYLLNFQIYNGRKETKDTDFLCGKQVEALPPPPTK